MILNIIFFIHNRFRIIIYKEESESLEYKKKNAD